MPCGHFFRSLLMFAPPPQPQSSTLASGVSSKKRSPHRATGLCPRFIMATIIFPPKPTGLRVFSKNDISNLQFYTLGIGQRERGFQDSAFSHRPAVLPQETQVFLTRPSAVEREARRLYDTSKLAMTNQIISKSRQKVNLFVCPLIYLCLIDTNSGAAKSIVSLSQRLYIANLSLFFEMSLKDSHDILKQRKNARIPP